jgi:LmbE family N-acetylglucosaminyl deacetylase
MAQPHVEPRTILIVMAHPDDGEFMAGAAIARWAREGHDIYYCLMTNGDVGSSDPEMTRERMITIRQGEAQEAARRLGVQHDVIFLNHVDSEVLHTLEARRDITRVIRKVRPDIVLAQDPTTYYHAQGYINHPDHRICGEITLAAIMPSASTRLIFPELLAEGLEPHKIGELYLTNTNQPDRWLAIEEEDLKQQAYALQAHKSQLKGDPTERVYAGARATADQARQHGHDFTYANAFKYFRFK